MLRYDCESLSFITLNEQNQINKRSKKIHVSQIEDIEYYIDSDLDVIEIDGTSVSTNCISLRFMRGDVFVISEDD